MAGFQLIRNQTSAEYPAPLETYGYPVAQTAALAVGDVVMAGTTGNDGIQDVFRATIKTGNDAGETTNSMIGVVVGNDIDPDNEVVGIPLNHATPRKVRVSTSQYAVYEAEVDGTSIVDDSIGLNCTIIVNTSKVGSLSTSEMVVDGGTTTAPDTTSTFPFRIVGITEYDENGKATKVLVRPNESSLTNTTGV